MISQILHTYLESEKKPHLQEELLWISFLMALLLMKWIDDPDHVLLATYPFGRFTTGARPTIVRLNIFNGGQKSYGKVPLGNARVLTDSYW